MQRLHRKEITISDIARETGVSIATVSRALNRPDSVKEATRVHVMDTAARLGYKINKPSQAFFPLTGEQKAQEDFLSFDDSGGLIIINIPSMSNPFYDELIKGARTSVIRHGYTLLINESHINNASIDSLLSMLVRHSASGLITLNRIETPLCERLRDILPVVQCSEYNKEAGLPYVSIDNAASAKTAVEHLLFSGRSRIAFLNGPLSYIYAQFRLQGYLSALEGAGVAVNNNYIVSLPDVNPELALSATLQLLNQPNPPDAFFAASDAFCAPILRACQLSGFQVPQDIAIVGFDNLEITKHLFPSITTVSQPKIQMGFLAAEMLFEQLINPETPVRSTLLDTELIVRESSTIAS